MDLSEIAWLDELPITPHGKVDRKALPAPARELDEQRYVAPRDDVETRVAAIWAALLRLERIGVEDNFFDLGGHSLLATQAVARISRELGVRLPGRRLFESPTVARLAAEAPQLGRHDPHALHPRPPTPAPAPPLFAHA